MNNFLKLVISLTLVVIGAVTGIFGLFELFEAGRILSLTAVSHPAAIAVFMSISGFCLAGFRLVHAVNIITNEIDEAERHC